MRNDAAQCQISFPSSVAPPEAPAAFWLLNHDIRLDARFASSRLLMQLDVYTMALSKPRLVFMVTSEAAALQHLKAFRSGLLITTQELQQGSAWGWWRQHRSSSTTPARS